MQCVVQCMIVHEWNVRAFIFSPEFVSFLFHLSLFSAKCRMQMLCPNYADEIPWSVLPMWYVNIVPLHAIDRLLTTDLDVKFLWMQTKCDASLDFSFLMQILFVGMSWCKCPFVGMSWCKCPFVGMSWCECPLMGMSWCKCFDANTIYSKIPFVFKIKASSTLETKNIFKSWFVISRKVIFLFFLFLT